MSPRARHPWVAAKKGTVSFALQAVAGRVVGDKGVALVRAGLHAERYGYDGFFLGDHPAWAPECWLHLAVIASQTQRIRLGQMVAASPYRAPLLIARLQADLDRLSAGRSVLGLGIGWNAADYGLGANEFDRMGLPYPSTATRQAMLEEAIEIIRGLWGSKPFTFSGEHYRATEAEIDPPPQAGGVPLVIAGGGKHTLEQVVRLGDVSNFGPGPAGGVGTAADARNRITVLNQLAHAAGRDPDDILRSHFSHWLILAPDESALRAKVARYFPDGLDQFWGKYLVAGTAESAAAYYQPYVDAGIEYFVFQTLDPDDEETFALTTGELAPQLRAPARD